MGFEDFFDLDASITDKDLEQLFKVIEKKQKQVEKQQKKLAKKGGALANIERTNAALPITNALTETGSSAIKEAQGISPLQGGQTRNLPKGKTPEDRAIRRDRLRGLLQSDLGTGKASQALSVLTNPSGFILSKIPIIGAALIAAGLVQQIWKILSQRGGLLSIWFEDRLNTRLNAFRDTLTQSSIKSGFTQIINETEFTTSPKDLYNSFQIFGENRQKLENDFSIRNKFGV